MMRKFSIFALSLFFVFLTVGPALAQPGRSGLSSQERRAAIEQKIEERKELTTQRRLELKESIEERRASQAARIANVRRQRIRHFFGLMKMRVEALILRIERLIDRIESRLAKIEEANEDIDTTPIHDEIQTANGLLEESKDLLILAEEGLENTLDSENPKDAFETVRESIHLIRDNLVDIRIILAQVIGDIKGLRVGQNDLNTATDSAE